MKVESSSLLPFSVLAKNTKKGGNAIEEKTSPTQSNNRRRAGHLQAKRERTKSILRFNAAYFVQPPTATGRTIRK